MLGGIASKTKQLALLVASQEKTKISAISNHAEHRPPSSQQRRFRDAGVTPAHRATRKQKYTRMIFQAQTVVAGLNTLNPSAAVLMITPGI